MPEDLRIGFVSIQDATNVHTWSSIPSNVARRLVAQGVDVQVFSPLSQRWKALLIPRWAQARMRGTTAQLDRSPVMLASYADQLTRLLRQTPVDVIVSTSSIPVAKLICPQPIVLWQDAVFHTMLDYYDDYTGLSRRLIQHGKDQEEAALRTCAIAAYASEWAARSARDLTDPDKVVVFPFGASVTVQHGEADVEAWARARRSRHPGRCELLFIGVDWVRKGGEVAVETARCLRELGIETRLTVVGCEPPERLPDWVRVLGFVSKRDAVGQARLAELLEASDFFILPTRAEAAGIVFCEASAFGLPSLAYATGGVPDYVRNGVNGVCLPPGTPADRFAQAIAGLLADGSAYEALCFGAFRDYESRLNWDSSVRELIALCRRAVNDASRPVTGLSPPREVA